MRIEDMKNWTVDQLKNEVVRLSEECEKRQHEILDLQERQIELERDFTKTVEENRKAHEDLDRANKVIEMAAWAKDGTIDLPFCDAPKELEHYRKLYQASNVRINELTITINTLVDMLADLRNALELRETCN